MGTLKYVKMEDVDKDGNFMGGRFFLGKIPRHITLYINRELGYKPTSKRRGINGA